MHFTAYCKGPLNRRSLVTKTLLVMKLTTILFFSACLQVSAKGYSQNISLNERGVPLEKVFRDIKQQIGYVFWYEDKLLRNTRKVDIQVVDVSLKQALDLCLNSQPLTYVIIDNTVVIRPISFNAASSSDTARPPESVLIPVNGKVTDEKGISIAGATVMEKNTRNATSTRDDGTFSLMVKPNARLIVSYVGYVSDVMAAGNNLRISLSPDTKNLSDVVVTGVGVATSRKKVAIDVATVSSKDFARSATTSIEQALGGQIAGVQVQQTSGRPGAAFNITLRGANNLDGTYPLIMVDGVEIKDLTSLDPATVDHIEVVKGPAGGMLYGAFGANGVIQVFTKKGSLNNRMSINLSSKVSVDNILKGKHSILAGFHHYTTDPAGDITDQLARPIKQSSTGIWTSPGVPDPTANPNLENNKPYNLPTFDHLKQAFRQALTFNNSVSVNGGGANFDYALAASIFNQQDVFSNSFSRANISLNLGIQPFKGFSVRSISQAVIGYKNLLNGNRFGVFDAYPWVDFNWKDSTGHRALKTDASSNQYNSLSEQEWHQRDNQSLEIFQNFDFNYKFARFLELDLKYGLDYQTNDSTDYYLNQTAIVQPGVYWGPDRKGSLTNAFSRRFFQNILYSGFLRTDFQKDFKLNIPLKTTTQVAYDYRHDNYRSYFAQGVQLPVYPPVNISSAPVKNVGDNYYAITTFGLLINQTIDYGNLMGISGGFRSDYSSQFGAGFKAATFPRGTFYFRPSELLGNLNWLADWKLRAAYGKAGTPPAQPYARQTTFTVTTLGNGVGLSIPNQASNDSLHELISSEWEAGTDMTFNFFKGAWLQRLVLTATWWRRTSSDIYQGAQVAPSTGYQTRYDNLSTIDSRGVDWSLDANMFSSSKVTWNMGVRWGFTKSTVTKIAGGQDIIAGEFAVKQGQSLGLFYGQTPLHSITQLQVDGKTPYIPVAQQSNYTITQGNVVNATTNMVMLSAKNDLSVIGKAYPDFTSSLFNTVTLFKTLTIAFQFDWVHGNNIYNITKQWLYTPAGGSGGSGGISADYDKKVTINGKTGSYVNYYQSLYNLVLPTSWFVENGSYIRLRDLSISYDLKNFIRVNTIKRISATISGRNLLTFTKYSGMDPENTGSFDSQGNTISGVGAFSGVDYFGVPNLRSYQFSLNIGF